MLTTLAFFFFYRLGFLALFLFQLENLTVFFVDLYKNSAKVSSLWHATVLNPRLDHLWSGMALDHLRKAWEIMVWDCSGRVRAVSCWLYISQAIALSPSLSPVLTVSCLEYVTESTAHWLMLPRNSNK